MIDVVTVDAALLVEEVGVSGVETRRLGVPSYLSGILSNGQPKTSFFPPFI